MAYKKNGMGKMNSGMGYKNAPYMLSEEMSAPSNMPRGNKSIDYAYVTCGGVMADDSVSMSDKESDQMASKLHKQLNYGKF